jgi:uncharacterized protein YndB with AHSA1/START domain
MNERIVLTRTFDATLDEVWEMWTTREGIEAWWGPEGFSVKVRRLDLRPGGELLYAMTADAPEQIAFMKSAGMPITTEARISFTEVERPCRLVYMHRVDFVPGVAQYDVATVVELEKAGKGVQLRLSLDRMHDEAWTQRMAAGWEMELAKLQRALSA